MTDITKADLHKHLPSTPAVATEEASIVRANAILTSTYVASSVINVADARMITMLLKIAAGAATGFVQLIPLLAPKQTTNQVNSQPLTTDDVWLSPLEYDGTNTSAVPGGTILAGADFTLSPAYARVAVRPLLLRTEAALVATDEIRVAVSVRCDWAGWFHVQCADTSGAGTLSDLEVKIVRTI